MVSAARVAQILTTVMATSRGAAGLPAALVDTCANALPVTGAGLAWMTDSGPAGSFAATDGAARVMEDLQFNLGEGPCVDCSTSGRPVLQSDLARTGGSRWPAFTAGALDAGIRAIFALPLQVGAIRLGVLDLYRDAPGALAEDALNEALAFADAGTAILLHLQTATDGGELQPHAAEPMDHHAEVHQATGMTSAQLDVSLATALALLRARAYASGRPVLDVAKDVVGRRLRLET